MEMGLMAGGKDFWWMTISRTAIIASSSQARYTLGILHQLVASGVVFGWPSLQRILESEGVFAQKCPGVPVINCNAASIKYNTIFTAGAFGATGGSLLFGLLFDRFGPRFSSIFGHIMMIIGVLMFAFSSNSLDMFLPAFLIMGLAGSPIQLAVLPCCNEFRLPAVAMTIYSGVFAAAALVFPLFELASHHGRVGHRTLFLLYVCMISVNLVLGVLFIPATVENDDAPLIDNASIVTVTNSYMNERSASSATDRLASLSFSGPLFPDTGTPAGDEYSSEVHTHSSDGNVDATTEGMLSLDEVLQQARLQSHDGSQTRQQELLSGSFRQQTFSRAFAMIAYFAIIHILRINFYVGTAAKQLAHMGDSSNTYTNAFSTFLPFGALCVLFTGPVFQAFGVIRTIMLFEACTLLYMVPVLIDNLPVQYLTFVVVSALRPFSFAVIFNAVNSLFGPRHFGTILGIVSTLGGLATLLQPPLLSLALGPCKGSFLSVNIGLLIAGSPLYVLPFHLDWFLRQPAPSPESVALEQRLLNRGRPAPDRFDAAAVEIPEVYSAF